MQPYGWIYQDEKRGVWQHKCWDNGPAVLGEYATRSEAYRASYGIKQQDLRQLRKAA
jgi:hypothetical protein